ncbi:unnamed protein product [Ambrosiozyma monospora]|uniref:Unnamed protein product n=1 Tax=Ambrosiozyma monospora TaxID=43982 RepID=A0A9W6Z6H9_AMBMO|nr:unnamed protein product [Ambrosiozyma monospora]
MKDGNGNPLIKTEKDFFFTLLSDGVNVMSKTHMSVEPFCIVIHNLPPELRYVSKFVHVAMTIPTCSDKQYFRTFLHPLVESLKKLSDDGFIVKFDDKEEHIYGHLYNISGDMPANAKLAAHTSVNSSHPCFCCPIERIFLKGVSYRKMGIYHLLASEYDPTLDFTVEDYIEAYCHIEDNLVGIESQSAFTELVSISQPTCFVPELMHICFENIVRKMGIFLFNLVGAGNNSNLTYLRMIFLKIFSNCNDSSKEKFLTIHHEGAYAKAEDLKLFMQNFYLVYLFRFGDVEIIKDCFRDGGDYYVHGGLNCPRSTRSNRVHESFEGLRRTAFLSITECSFILQLFILLNYPEDELPFLKTWVLEYSKKLEALKSEVQIGNKVFIMLTFPFHMMIHIPDFMEQFGPLRAFWSFCMERACRTVKFLSNANFSRIQSISIKSMMKTFFESLQISSMDYVPFGMKTSNFRKGYKAPPTVFNAAKEGARYGGKRLKKNEVDHSKYTLKRVTCLKLKGGDFTDKTTLCYINTDKGRIYAWVRGMFHYEHFPTVDENVFKDVTILSYVELPPPEIINETFETGGMKITVKAMHFYYQSVLDAADGSSQAKAINITQDPNVVHPLEIFNLGCHDSTSTDAMWKVYDQRPQFSDIVVSHESMAESH